MREFWIVCIIVSFIAYTMFVFNLGRMKEINDTIAERITYHEKFAECDALKNKISKYEQIFKKTGIGY